MPSPRLRGSRAARAVSPGASKSRGAEAGADGHARGAAAGSAARAAGVGLVPRVWALFTDWRYFGLLSVLIMLGEAALGSVIILRVPYTEIDWIAYMEEVEGWLGGEMDYLKLRGQTGPLPYPAGFLYVYAALRWATGWGAAGAAAGAGREAAIAVAQWCFLGMSLLLTAACLAIYERARACPPWVAILLAASRRVHSIFVLRLFNDAVAMVLLYIAVYYFTRRRWTVGCVWFSVATSIKMNILLFSFPLLLLLLRNTGVAGAARRIAVCAAVQLALGAPFLLTYPRSYISRSFDLGRVFMYKWTTNWKFLPEEVFVGKPLAVALLAAHLIGVFVIGYRRWSARYGGVRAAFTGEAHKGTRRGGGIPPEGDSAAFIVTVLFVGNFIGIVFARTLHFQFYCWYYHTIPFLLWQTRLPTPIRLALLVGIEAAFNMTTAEGTATARSALLLQACHVTLLAALFWAPLCLSLSPERLQQLNAEHAEAIRALARGTAADPGRLEDDRCPASLVAVAVSGADERGITLTASNDPRAATRSAYIAYADRGVALKGTGADDVGRVVEIMAASARKSRAA